MSRTLVCSCFLAAELAILCAAMPLRAAEPALHGGNPGSGSITVGEGRLILGSQYSGGTFSVSGEAAAFPAIPIQASQAPDKVFYIVLEGAGLGDNVRAMPCSGKETVLDAISLVNGLTQVSSTKIWIARPSPSSPDKSTILPVDWDAIAKRGINTTNHSLAPGDRLVIGEDPLITRTNIIAKRTGPIERVMGCLSLSVSSLNAVSSPQAANEAVKEMVRKGMFTDDEELKKIVLDAIGRREQKDR